MQRRDVEFKTVDDVTLRGWFYSPAHGSGDKHPCVVMSHGFSAVKEMDLDIFAEQFSSQLPLNCLVYDQRGFGASDVKEGQPRQEIIPSVQQSDLQDAITYAQTIPEVDGSKIGIWGSSYSGGNVLVVAASDRRVKAVIAQAPFTNGWENAKHLVRSDMVPAMNEMFAADRHARAEGKPAGVVPVVTNDPLGPAALPTPDSYEFFTAWEKKCPWKNEVTVKSVEHVRTFNPAAFVEHIAPTPLLMVVAENDVLTPTQTALDTFWKAREPKELKILPGGHFDAYSGPNFELSSSTQVDFWKRNLLKHSK